MTASVFRAAAVASVALLCAGPAIAAAAPAPFVRTYSYVFPLPVQHLTGASDFNGDGRRDLAVSLLSPAPVGLGPDRPADDPPPAIYVFTSNGNGHFSPHPVAALVSAPGTLAAADMNGDGRTDLVHVSKVYTPTTEAILSILLNQAGTVFSRGPTIATAGTGPYTSVASIAPGDFNGDGRTDIVAADTDPMNLTIGNYSGETAFAAWGQSDGSFVRGRISPAALFPQHVVATDFNVDGRPDLALAGDNNEISASYVGPGQTAANFAGISGWSGASHTDIQGLATGDLNGDGRPDLIASAYTASGGVGGFGLALLRNNFSQTYTFRLQYATTVSLPWQPRQARAADLNGDGKLDLVVALYSNRGISVAVLMGHGDMTFDPPQFIEGAGTASDVDVGDYNGDGRPDIAVLDVTHNLLETFQQR